MSDYDVHICYNGLGIENTFISHLKHAFHERQISTTDDDNWNIRGEDVSQTTLEAIEKARSSVLVFCKSFPSKRRCLDELDKVLECEKKGQLVRVIYFQIDPSVVQKLEGSYGTAMAEHREMFKNDSTKVDRWEVSLNSTAQLRGRKYTNGNQSRFIQQFVADYFAELNSRITEPQNLLDSVTRGRGARNLPKAAGDEPFFRISRIEEPENRERFIAVQPSTSTGYAPKFKGPEGTDRMQCNVPLDLPHSEVDATRKRKEISNLAEFNFEGNAPQKQILTGIKYCPLLDSRGVEDDLISRKLKGASVGVVNSTPLAVKDAGTVTTRISEEMKSFMQTVLTNASKSFHELIAEGSEFKDHIEKNVLRFRADKKISPGMCDVLDGLLHFFTCWSQQYDLANTNLERTAAYLSKANKLQADFDAAVNDCGKAVSDEEDEDSRLGYLLRIKEDLEQQMKAVDSAIADLDSSRQKAASRKSSLFLKGKKLKEERDNLLVQLPRIEGEWLAAKVTQEKIEAGWLNRVEVFNGFLKSEFGL